MATRTQAKVYFERRSQARLKTPLVSLIVPVFNEAEVIPHFLEETNKVLTGLGLPFEYIFVDDGSHDTTADVVAQNLKDGLPGKLIGLSRNFGKEAALTAGLSHVKGDVAIVLDADLQDPPSLVPQMIEGWRSGYDVVYGMRVDRSSDTFLKRSTAGLFYKLFNRLAHIDMPANAGDFRLIDRAVIEALHKLPERNRFMKGLFAWVGFPSLAIPYERPARRAGEGKWNYWKLWNFAIDGLTAFTTLPLRVWLYGGVGIAGLALVYALYTIIKVLIYGVDVPGYASLMVAVLFFSGIQLLSIGMVGEYIARLFGEAKQRPVYLVQDVITGADTKVDGKASND
ncbi:putative Bactoprenol glucosyl transferase-like protein from prophage CPS-53 [Roseibium sp. TrichSKD4]|uniref:glycosyltransferase family 2 protein n=1 Tax=Roseibium sp. TrichSKD4 TaxID=744980 RepID=UPI0001E5656C|nr:glycosyltransferase family 2 protein [Roseibium sp. TrichSKD4]EFO33500.1 putative Bactoprenol glucosyl transferase-like protein from prophage CPS-53 [Roseibium sp. TrichSKD4]